MRTPDEFNKMLEAVGKQCQVLAQKKGDKVVLSSGEQRDYQITRLLVPLSSNRCKWYHTDGSWDVNPVVRIDPRRATCTYEIPTTCRSEEDKRALAAREKVRNTAAYFVSTYSSSNTRRKTW